jgi:Domain of unknown function DUF29
MLVLTQTGGFLILRGVHFPFHWDNVIAMEKPFLYDEDFYGWTQQQAKALEQRLVMELDWQHLQEEIQALGRQEYRELVSRLSVLIRHLQKLNMRYPEPL